MSRHDVRVRPHTHKHYHAHTRARMRVLSRPRARAQRMHCSGGTSRTSSPRTLRTTWLRPAFARRNAWRPRRLRPRTRPRIRPQRWRPRRLRPWTRPRLRPLSPLIRPMSTHTLAAAAACSAYVLRARANHIMHACAGARQHGQNLGVICGGCGQWGLVHKWDGRVLRGHSGASATGGDGFGRLPWTPCGADVAPLGSKTNPEHPASALRVQRAEK